MKDNKSLVEFSHDEDNVGISKLYHAKRELDLVTRSATVNITANSTTVVCNDKHIITFTLRVLNSDFEWCILYSFNRAINTETVGAERSEFFDEHIETMQDLVLDIIYA